MQAIPDEIKKCVVFIYYKNGDEDREILCGTGFFVSAPLPDMPDQYLVYLITAKHVITGIEMKARNGASDGKVYIKLNNKKGTADHHLRTEVSHWKYHPTDSSVDAAVLQTTPSRKEFDYKTIPLDMVVTDAYIEEEEIGAGDEIFLTGLFHSHHGKTKNLPIVRTGNIALMPEEKVYTKSIGDIDAYLIEARSIGGLSGSPVFIYLSHTRSKNGSLNLGGGRLFGWLGVMHGHWDIDEGSVDSEMDTTGIVGRSVNMGIGIVVPATKVVEIIEREDFMADRKRVAKQIKDLQAPTEDSLASEPSEEQFKETLKKVSRKTNTSKPNSSKPKTSKADSGSNS